VHEMSRYGAGETVSESAENSNKTAGLPEHLEAHKWPKGFCPNPGGRPKKKPVTEALERLLDSTENAEEVAKALLDMVKARGAGTVQAAKEITDRVEGKVAERSEITGADGGPIEGKFVIEFVKPEANG
jgi:hypothetical protein